MTRADPLIKTILLADPDEARKTEYFLKEKGFRVLAVRNGAEALQATISRRPDLVVFDEDCRLLDAASFLRIVQSNPMTAKIPVLIASATGEGPRLLPKPLDWERMVSAIGAALREGEAAEGTGGEEATAGTLDPLSVVDLLQALTSSRRSGKLVLRSPSGEGVIWITDGDIRDAHLGSCKGKKALFRLLAFQEGEFELRPGASSLPSRIEGSFDVLVLESVREQDELPRVMEKLPSPRERLVAAVDPELVPVRNPSFAPLLSLLWGEARSIREVMDAAAATDLEVAIALEELLRIGWIRVAPGPRMDQAPLLGKEARRHLIHRLPPPRFRGEIAGKLLVVGEDETVLQQAIRRLSTAREFHPRSQTGLPLVGTIASLDFGGGLLLEVVSLPSLEELAPLAIFLTQGALGALVVGSGDTWSWLSLYGPMPVVEADPASPIPALRELLAAL